MRKALPVALIALIVFAAELLSLSNSHLLLADFHAFYCGGWTLIHGFNPYDAAPMMRCESTNMALPAPFPGYALAFFAIFGALPYAYAAALWVALSLVSLAGAAMLLAKLCDCEPWEAAAVIALPFLSMVVPFGELSPLIFPALVFCALQARSESPSPGLYVALAFCALLPHVAIPMFLALLIWKPAARVGVIVAGASLCLLDVLAGGPHIALEYMTRVLPVHAASEIAYIAQYSATWAAQAAGAPDALALAIGKADYAIMVIAGIAIGGMVARRLRDDAATVLIPSAFAVFGGLFIHYSEMLLALAAAMLLFSRTNGYARLCSACAIVLLVVPWQWLLKEPARVLEAVAATALVCALFLRLNERAVLRAALGAAVLACIIVIAGSRLGPQTTLRNAHVASGTNLAQRAWAQRLGREDSSGGIVWWLAKAPTWAGLLLLTLGSAYAVAQKQIVAPVVVN